jgi:hypothetical protein
MTRLKFDASDKIRIRRVVHKLVIILIALAATLGSASTAYAEKPEITREVRHAFSTVQHFDPIPECGFPGATEYATGNDRLIIIDKGDSWHVTFGETFRILEVPDDPALPSWERKGTDTLHFNLTKGGTETFTEAYHESGSSDDGKNVWTSGTTAPSSQPTMAYGSTERSSCGHSLNANRDSAPRMMSLVRA